MFGFIVKLAIRWLTNRDMTSALKVRPSGPIQRPLDSPLIGISVPFAVSARLSSDGDRVPASWKMRS